MVVDPQGIDVEARHRLDDYTSGVPACQNVRGHDGTRIAEDRVVRIVLCQGPEPGNVRRVVSERSYRVVTEVDVTHRGEDVIVDSDHLARARGGDIGNADVP